MVVVGRINGGEDGDAEDEDEEEEDEEASEEEDAEKDPYLYYMGLRSSIQSDTRKENVCSECEYPTSHNDLIECKGPCQQFFHLECLGLFRYTTFV